MIIFAILSSFAAIALLCWLLFTLATFALPVFIGVNAGLWAHGSGAGLVAAIGVGFLAAAATLVLGQFLIALARPIWAKLLVAVAFVAPATVAGFHATHGIVKHLMPSETCQIVFAIFGGIAVGATAWVRVVSMAPAGPSQRGFARA